MKHKELVYSIDDIDNIVDVLIDLMQKYSIFTFSGDLGAGKTTLIKSFLKRNGISDVITSPTFAYVNKYQNKKNMTFYHFDLYRLGNLKEFMDFGFDEFLYEKDSWSLIEWPEVIMPILKFRVCNLFIDYFDENKRILKIQLIDDN